MRGAARRGEAKVDHAAVLLVTDSFRLHANPTPGQLEQRMNKVHEIPCIGVGVTAYNAEKYLGTCLDSLLAQTYPNVRIVVCEDCSEDNTQEILGTYVREYPRRIRAVFNTKNLGIQPNVNKA